MPKTSVLGIDFGHKRLGLAIGQQITGTATPLRAVRCDIDALATTLTEWQPEAIVLGYPLHADNSETALCQQIKAFGAALQARYALPVFYENEYLSSNEAAALLREQRRSGVKSRSKAKALIDPFAAALILQRWMNKHEPR